MTTNKCTGKT